MCQCANVADAFVLCNATCPMSDDGEIEGVNARFLPWNRMRRADRSY